MHPPLASPSPPAKLERRDSRSRVLTLASTLALVAGAGLLLLGMLVLGLRFLALKGIFSGAISFKLLYGVGFGFVPPDMAMTILLRGAVLAALGAFGLSRRSRS